MKDTESISKTEAVNEISTDETRSIFEAVSEAFPLIVSANLTKNTYTMIKDDGFLSNTFPLTGKYDDLIDHGVENIHENYQKAFLDHFSREQLLNQFKQGRKEVYVKLYQKGHGDHYQWVSTHVIRVRDRDGDICQICLNRVLSDACAENPNRHCRAPY